MTNKYQEALDNICKYNYPINPEDIRPLQELIDKYYALTARPKLLPCKCGYNRRYRTYTATTTTLVCMNCGFKVTANTDIGTVRKWNEEVGKR